jgi:hypothetical protein
MSDGPIGFDAIIGRVPREKEVFAHMTDQNISVDYENPLPLI